MIMSKQTGALTWFVPDCYFPEVSSPGHYVSHEAICILNPGQVDAHLQVTLYFEDRPPQKGFVARCDAERTNHLRLDIITDAAGCNVPQGIPYALMVESDQPIIVQYSRLDTTQAEMSLMTTMAHPLG